MGELQKDDKVALISFHNALNYGAALQAFALQYILRNNLCLDAEYINYENKYRYELYNMRARFLNAIKSKNLQRAVMTMVGWPLMNIRRKRFKHFYDNNVIKTNKVYRNSKEAKELNIEYRKFIVGSDQIWNNVNNGSDFAYLLDFVDDDGKKISYSSSFGMSSIPKGLYKLYQENLSRFSRLAVREEKGVELVQQLTGRKAHLVLDPVFLLTSDEWEKFIINDYKKDYVFSYVDSSIEVSDFKDVCKSASNYEFHILCSNIRISDVLNPKIKSRISMSPERFLSEIKNAEYVLTDSFHCLAFCIIFHKRFTVILSGNRGKDERLLNLLSITGLTERVYNPEKIIDFTKEIDYRDVDNRIKPFRDYSISYLKSAIFDTDEPEYLNCSSEDSHFFCDDERCTGCSACVNACPARAIVMKKSRDGFLFPEINEEKCIKCNKCHNVCQVFNKQNKEKDTILERWAIKTDDSVRIMSTSGGAFSAISNYILLQNGYICAATFDQTDFSLKHKISNNKDDRDAMRGTYYFQSELNDIFMQVKELLESGKLVLFVGTGCQVRGLKLYLGKDFERLICCDIVCHGVASPMVFEKYIEYLKKAGSIEEIKLRDKTVGWRGYTESVVINGKKKSKKLSIQSFDSLFSHNIINRRSCADCQFANMQREGDITIGDCWGIEKYAPDFEDKLGVSLIICSTEKGKKLFNNLKDIQKIRIDADNCMQNSLTKATLSSHKRNKAFKELEMNGYEAMAKKYGEVNFIGWCKQFVRAIK